MDLTTYQTEARVTATFDPAYKITYPALGLVDEAGEFAEKYEDPTTDPIECQKELGDVLWYFSAVCDFAGFQLADFFSGNSFMEFEGLPFLIAASKVAGICKKSVRDNGGTVNAPKLAIQLAVIANMLKGAVLFGLNTTIEEVAEMNIAKLRDRQQRNVIKGDGDNR